MGRVSLPKDSFSDGETLHQCNQCNFLVFALSLKKHLSAHRKKEILNSATPLKIPTPSCVNKQRRNRKIKNLVEGAPGDVLLPPPISTPNSLQYKYAS
ncbi:hypothetical protein NPIL_606681 [Nephila pilipes]|uniref:Uncharacterized protein n=1 Tax=Nephila pilipes TaxID=299642 RepID=A0A8X6THW3_NEPPI|nr:hypothetical protein NPIL_606681 [Nephila pilipes]